MIRQKHIILAAAGALLVGLAACKPTEKNYKAAYDAAIQKRNEAAAEQMRPATGLLSDEGPQLRMLNGDSVYVQRERIRETDGAKLPGTWAVAVGMYKMDTNAKASVGDIKVKGFGAARVAKGAGGVFYAVADTASSLDEAAIRAKLFKAAFPQYPYVGLPGAPVLIAH